MAFLRLKYTVKLTKRIGFLVTLVILTLLASCAMREEETEELLIDIIATERATNHSRSKFILLWTDPKASPFSYFGKGSIIFRTKSCEYTNCYVTGDRDELGDSSMFDAVLFNGPQLTQMLKNKDFPTSRSVDQKYVYANVESAENYPLCHFNGFFNWTWTYRLDSDVIYGYYVVKNRTNQVVAPDIGVTWEKMENMKDIDEKVKNKLKNKRKAVAWFASNCHTKSRREDLVEKLQSHLKTYNRDVDVYGACGTFQCPSYINQRCLRLLEKDYYFYFAFENSFSVDYVTEKVVTALRHYTVPVVYGGANYSRFLPPGSYLNANELSAEELAATINRLIANPDEYYKYFRWHAHYSFHLRHESPETDDYCKFCEVLSSERAEEGSVHWAIKEWWNGNYSCPIDEKYH